MPPAKRRRVGSDADASPGSSAAATGEPDPRAAKASQRTRSNCACENCRNRKTRCDNQRPSCSYCKRVGVRCTYPEDSPLPLSEGVALQLLSAIDHLTGLVTRESHERGARGQPPDAAPPLPGQALEAPPRPEVSVAPETSPPRASPTAWTAGLESVLEWDIFPKPLPHMTAPTAPSPRDHDSGSSMPPSMELPEMMALTDRFVTVVHTKNPIVDLPSLYRLVRQTSENGPDWSISTCLVALVCALGALSMPYVPRTRIAPDPEHVDRGPSPELAKRYWHVAERRLGLAMGQTGPGWGAVQCLCLAGIWHMCNMHLFEAWKCFNLACNSWYITSLSKNLTPGDSEPSQDATKGLTIEQSLYFTCYKSECEITFEHALPASVLGNIDYPHAFPAPPELGHHGIDEEAMVSEQQSWYYYLAEIASRHLINRLLQVQKQIPVRADEHTVHRLLASVELLEAQLDDWYQSLPPSVSFPIPVEQAQPLESDVCYFLRARYMIIRELLCRPFVRLCTTYPIRLPEPTATRVIEQASRGLQLCLLKIQSASPTQHHGSWFQLHNFVTCSLMLIAAERAKDNPVLNGAARITMPVNWRHDIMLCREMMAESYTFNKTRVRDTLKILDWALWELDPGSSSAPVVA